MKASSQLHQSAGKDSASKTTAANTAIKSNNN
jgi:hypothetical protein